MLWTASAVCLLLTLTHGWTADALACATGELDVAKEDLLQQTNGPAASLPAGDDAAADAAAIAKAQERRQDRDALPSATVQPAVVAASQPAMTGAAQPGPDAGVVDQMQGTEVVAAEGFPQGTQPMSTERGIADAASTLPIATQATVSATLATDGAQTHTQDEAMLEIGIGS